MGHGAPRELEGNNAPLPELDAALSEKLGHALKTLDAADANFRQARDEERFMQRVKTWNNTCKEIDAHLRIIGQVLIQAHQFSLDIGSDGGGKNTQPWIEEVGLTIPRLHFRLEDDGSVSAVSDGNPLMRCALDQVGYAWLERAVIAWAVAAASRKG
jgi:hypothetical protein